MLTRAVEPLLRRSGWKETLCGSRWEACNGGDANWRRSGTSHRPTRQRLIRSFRCDRTALRSAASFQPRLGSDQPDSILKHGYTRTCVHATKLARSPHLSLVMLRVTLTVAVVELLETVVSKLAGFDDLDSPADIMWMTRSRQVGCALTVAVVAVSGARARIVSVRREPA